MVSFFPTPYPDEIFYGLISRYHLRSGNIDSTPTIKELFGTNKITATVDLPCNIDTLVKNISNICDITKEDFIYNNTLLPFFKPFWTQTRVDEVERIMGKGSVRTAHLKAGINSCSVSPWKYLRYCPQCITDDEKKHGEPYWHRLHQASGVLVCPVHGLPTQNSNIRVYEVNPNIFYTASESSCEANGNPYNFTNQSLNIFLDISNDIRFVLSNRLECIDPNTIRDRYFEKLREYGFVSWKGQIDQKSFVTDFISYYTTEVLEILNLIPKIDDPHNWVSLMVRKHHEFDHPLKHILLIRYLFENPQDFYFYSKKQKIFGEGPFPCLNAAAEHYMKDVISDYKAVYSRNRKHYGIFTCDCGFVYERSETHKDVLNKYKYSTIKEYGETWDNKFRELIEDKQLHLREVAKLLKVDLKTIRKNVIRLNLYTPWMNYISELKECVSEIAIAEALDRKRDYYRERWKSLVGQNIGASKSCLRAIDMHTYNWLYYNDKEWLAANSPQIKHNSKAHCTVDWFIRDEQIRNKLINIVHELLTEDGKPERITHEKLGRRLGMLFLIRNNIDKLPKTKEYINSVCEDKFSFYIRKIKWAKKYLISAGEPLSEWRIRQLAGLVEIKSEVMKKAIEEIIY